HAADRNNQRDIKQRARPHRPEHVGLADRAALDVDLGVIGDQPRRPANFRHHGIAGVDAQAALDAAEARAVANVDPGRAHGDALVAVYAIADALAAVPRRYRFFQRHALLASVATIGD